LKEFSKTPLQESRKKGVVLNIHAHAGKPDFKIKGFSKWQNAIEVEVKAFPQKGNANAEIEKKLGDWQTKRIKAKTKNEPTDQIFCSNSCLMFHPQSKSYSLMEKYDKRMQEIHNF